MSNDDENKKKDAPKPTAEGLASLAFAKSFGERYAAALNEEAEADERHAAMLRERERAERSVLEALDPAMTDAEAAAFVRQEARVTRIALRHMPADAVNDALLALARAIGPDTRVGDDEDAWLDRWLAEYAAKRSAAIAAMPETPSPEQG